VHGSSSAARKTPALLQQREARNPALVVDDHFAVDDETRIRQRGDDLLDVRESGGEIVARA
jgi:hypothetical protein